VRRDHQEVQLREMERVKLPVETIHCLRLGPHEIVEFVSSISVHEALPDPFGSLDPSSELSGKQIGRVEGGWLETNLSGISAVTSKASSTPSSVISSARSRRESYALWSNLRM
jgi:hypothetical protein